ncbi:MAG: hypothetical protein U9Q34_07165, partial [Elusimicrobiota bacterium]|nr:hypothetical protein [Elusimicrobiota bacterium]
EAFINSFILELSSGSARDVFKSTEPEKEIKGYIKKGFYRQEMLIMFFMALESSFTFKSLAADIEKGKTLEYLAAKTKVNLMEMFKRTGKIKKRIEIRMTDYVSPGSIKTKIEKKAESRKQKSAQETGNNISATEITNDKKEENTKKKK